ncbi:hypothetical protein RvY_11529 [Ramazzottius varieornatus]|uniref:Uncharacterized protein n=1 Tax=Ramazzottius varieornatus TaxID=947166 RepID=A0A1D1VKR5_RAMVA|nr:hypothetical protein RvY_11529 [Ramazzottius varieornatus]
MDSLRPLYNYELVNSPVRIRFTSVNERLENRRVDTGKYVEMPKVIASGDRSADVNRNVLDSSRL